MKTSTCLFFVFLLCKASPSFSNYYVILYATCSGNTGHTGIAVDRHEIVSYEIASATAVLEKTDTVAIGRLYYYDFWPKEDVFIRKHYGRDLTPAYYKLPQSSSEAPITVHSLIQRGIPHKENFPVDGIVEIKTTAAEDLKLIAYLDAFIDEQLPFNARSFNCADFVLKGINNALGIRMKATEFVPFSFCSTPNKLFRKLTTTNVLNTKVILDPGAKLRGSFLSQKVIPEAKKRLRTKFNKHKTNEEVTTTNPGRTYRDLPRGKCTSARL